MSTTGTNTSPGAGTLLPVDDPWWQTHYPPNGWGCKCWVRQVSRREAERLGGCHPTTSGAPGGMDESKDPRDCHRRPRTGPGLGAQLGT